MNQQSKITMPTFFLSAPAPCPYLANKQERKLFSVLSGAGADAIHNSLTHSGFRRSQNIVYRPACEACKACQSVRIVARDYQQTKSDKRIINRNADVVATHHAPQATDEQFTLLSRYLNSRHAQGSMTTMTRKDYTAMVQDSDVDTYLIEYRREGKLVACLLGDRMYDGFSLVYSFYTPDAPQDSLGNYMILEHIKRATQAQLPYLYLGYLVENCQKMAYKKRFQPLQSLTQEGWLDYET